MLGQARPNFLTAAFCLFDSLTVSKPLSLCRLLSPSAHSAGAALIHKQHTHSHALSHDYTNAETGLQPRLAHAHKTHSLTHSGIIVVVKLERKRERERKKGREKQHEWDRQGEGEGGKKRVIAPTEVFYPQAVFKRCHVRDPVIRTNHCFFLLWQGQCKNVKLQWLLFRLKTWTLETRRIFFLLQLCSVTFFIV